MQAAIEQSPSSLFENMESNKAVVTQLISGLRTLLNIFGRKLATGQQQVTLQTNNLEVALWKLAGEDFADRETKKILYCLAPRITLAGRTSVACVWF